MSTEQFMREPPKNRAPELLAYLAVAVVMFGAGMLLESHLDAQSAAQTAASAKLAQENGAIAWLDDVHLREGEKWSDIS
jgi:hypothetical protein